MEKKPVAVFASGSGTTFEAILQHSKKKDSSFFISSLVSDKEGCRAVGIARSNNVDVVKYDHKTSEELLAKKTDLIVLAGFLKIVDSTLLESFPDHIINIHPSLLPSFGGRGYYGIRVHRAAIEYGVQYSGFTIHIVNSDVDRGPIIFQYAVPVLQDDTPERLQERVHKYELEYYPPVIQGMLQNGFKKEGNRVLVNFR